MRVISFDPGGNRLLIEQDLLTGHELRLRFWQRIDRHGLTEEDQPKFTWKAVSLPPQMSVVAESVEEGGYTSESKLIRFQWQVFHVRIDGPSEHPAVFEEFNAQGHPRPWWVELRAHQNPASPEWLYVEAERPRAHNALDVLLSYWQPGEEVVWRLGEREHIRPNPEALLTPEQRLAIRQAMRDQEPEVNQHGNVHRWVVPGPPTLEITETGWPGSTLTEMTVRGLD